MPPKMVKVANFMLSTIHYNKRKAAGRIFAKIAMLFSGWSVLVFFTMSVHYFYIL